MRSAEFRVWREFLGLPIGWCADKFGLSTRKVANWERSDREIPSYATLVMDGWIDLTSQTVGRLTIADLGPAILVPLDGYGGDDLGGMPPSWHRMVAARVAERTGLPVAAK